MLSKISRRDKSLTALVNGSSSVYFLRRLGRLGGRPLLPPWQIGSNGSLRLGLIPLGSCLSAYRSVSLGTTLSGFKQRYVRSNHATIYWVPCRSPLLLADLIRRRDRDGADGSGRARTAFRWAQLARRQCGDTGGTQSFPDLGKSWYVLGGPGKFLGSRHGYNGCRYTRKRESSQQFTLLHVDG